MKSYGQNKSRSVRSIEEEARRTGELVQKIGKKSQELSMLTTSLKKSKRNQ